MMSAKVYILFTKSTIFVHNYMVLYIQQETRVINSKPNLSSLQKLEVLIMFELTPFGYRRVASYNPFRELEEMSHSFWNDADVSGFRTDIKKVDGNYVLEAELPGFKKEEISLELNNGYLTISTEKSLEKDEENKKGKMLRQERYAGVMQRSFYVGKNLTEEDIKASYESGVLHVSIPKKDAPKAHEKKTILIEG